MLYIPAKVAVVQYSTHRSNIGLQYCAVQNVTVLHTTEHLFNVLQWLRTKEGDAEMNVIIEEGSFYCRLAAKLGL